MNLAFPLDEAARCAGSCAGSAQSLMYIFFLHLSGFHVDFFFVRVLSIRMRLYPFSKPPKFVVYLSDFVY